MDLPDVLKVEYEQQYEQYRWIGRQQFLVATFYGAIVAAVFAVLHASSYAASHNVQGILSIILGMFGIVVSVALVYSRAMQHRTAIYLLELLIQMTEKVHPDTLDYCALRFKRLVMAPKGFDLHNTVIIAIPLVFLSGDALICFGAFLLVDDKALIWLLLIFVLFAILGLYPLSRVLRKEHAKAVESYESSKAIATEWKNHLRRGLELKCQ
jgi:hypothetical protein